MSQPKPTFCFHCSVLSSMVLETWFEQKPPPIYFAFFKNFENFSDKISKQKYWFMEERKKSQKITRYSLNCLNFFWDIKPLNPSWIFHLFGPFFFTLDFSEMIKFLPFTILEKWEEEEVVVVLAVGAQCTAVTKKWKNNSISNC